MAQRQRGFLGLLKRLLAVPERRRPAREPVAAQASSDNPGGIFLDKTPEWFERQYAEGKRSREVDRYLYQLIEPLEKGLRSGDCAAVIRYSKESLPLLEAVIRWTKKDLGAFEITSIPAIYPGGRVMAAMGDAAGVRAIETEVTRHLELEPWRTIATELVDDLRLVDRILAMVAEKPGAIVQKDLRHTLGVDAERVREICYWMTKGGRLRREKAGPSYRLSVAAGCASQPG